MIAAASDMHLNPKVMRDVCMYFALSDANNRWRGLIMLTDALWTSLIDWINCDMIRGIVAVEWIFNSIYNIIVLIIGMRN